MDTLLTILDHAFNATVAYTAFVFWRDFADRHGDAD